MLNFLRRLRVGWEKSWLAAYANQFRRNARLFLLSTFISGVTIAGFQLFFTI